MKAWSPNNANVDAIQAPNVPHVVGDQANATLLNDLNHTRDRAAAIDAFAAARNGAARLVTAPQVAAQPLPAAQPAPPADARPITKANAPGRRALVLSTRWPRERCRKHGGYGWETTIVSATNSTATVRFNFARTRDGRPYANERVPITDLVPL